MGTTKGLYNSIQLASFSYKKLYIIILIAFLTNIVCSQHSIYISPDQLVRSSSTWHPLIWRYSAATILWDCEWYSCQWHSAQTWMVQGRTAKLSILHSKDWPAAAYKESQLIVTDEDPRGRNVSPKSVVATWMLKKIFDQGVPTKKIINGLIVELIRHQRLKKPPTKTLVKWIELLYGTNWPTNPPAELTLIKSLNVIHQ